MQETLTPGDFYLAIFVIAVWFVSAYLVGVALPILLDRWYDWRHKTNLVREVEARRRCHRPPVRRGRWE